MYSVLYKGEGMKDKKLGYYFKVMANELARNCNKDLEQIGLTSSQCDILLYLVSHDKEDINQRDIEQFFKLSNPTVSGILERLEIKGFIIRKPSCKDARSKQIQLTEKSIEINKDMKRKIEELEKNLLKDVSPEELLIFKKVAKQLHDNIIELNTRKEDQNERNI